MKNNKGLTTIELILAILIAGIVMGAVGNFLVFNMRTFNTTTDIIDIQYEGQLAMTQLVNIIRESTGVNAIDDDLSVSGDAMDKAYELTPERVEFIHTEWDGSTDLETSYLLEYDNSTELIECTVTEPATPSYDYDLSHYITNFTLEPVGNGVTADFQNADNIIIRLTLEQDGVSIDLESQVKIRNKN